MSKILDLSAVSFNSEVAATKTSTKTGRFQSVTPSRRYLCDGPAHLQVVQTALDFLELGTKSVDEGGLGLASVTQVCLHVIYEALVAKGYISLDDFKALIPQIQEVKKGLDIPEAVEDTERNIMYIPLSLASLHTTKHPIVSARLSKEKKGQLVLFFDEAGNVCNGLGEPVDGHGKVPFPLAVPEVEDTDSAVELEDTDG